MKDTKNIFGSLFHFLKNVQRNKKKLQFLKLKKTNYQKQAAKVILNEGILNQD